MIYVIFLMISNTKKSHITYRNYENMFVKFPLRMEFYI